VLRLGVYVFVIVFRTKLSVVVCDKLADTVILIVCVGDGFTEILCVGELLDVFDIREVVDIVDVINDVRVIIEDIELLTEAV